MAKKKPSVARATEKTSQAWPAAYRLTFTAVLLFLSGACALIYQVSWFRQSRYFFGNATMATSAVMAIFMGGLGLGSLILGARADRRRRPLRFYGVLEWFIGLGAGLSLLVMLLARKTYIALGGIESLGSLGAALLRLALSCLVIGLPTFLMGGTLPAAVRAVTAAEDTRRRGVGWLYGANTLGACSGGLAAAFVFHEKWGVTATIWLAVAVNLAVAGAAVLASPRFGASPLRTPPPSPAQDQVPSRAAPKGFVLFSAGLVGFIFLMQEMVWYRMLAPLLGGSTYTISLILCAALLGIGIGGLCFPLLHRNRPALLAGFSLTCAWEGLLIGLPFALGDRLAVWTVMLTEKATHFGALVGAWVLILLVVVAPASIVAGFQFPLLIALLGKGRRHLGKEIGQAYVYNAGGAIAGAVAGGFGLMILLSAPGVWQLSAGILAALALAAALLSAPREHKIKPLVGTALLLLTLVFCLTRKGPTAAWRHSGIGAGRAELTDFHDGNAVQNWLNVHRRQMIWERDGVESSVGVSDAEGIKFIVNGRTDGNALTDAHTQVMGGLIGAALHPRPQTALVIGLGTGSTAGWLADIATVKRVDVIELEPAVAHVARLCTVVNRDVMNHPKVRIIWGDAREFLLTTRADYDIIFSEPSNPYRAGIASLYTVEYYRAAEARLREGGIFLQWLQGYSVDATTVSRVYSTLAAVFPRVETWLSGGADLILTASARTEPYESTALKARLGQAPFAEALRAAWRVEGMEGFFSRYLANHAFTQRMAVFGPDEWNTDDQTYIEFAMARSVGRSLFNPYEIFQSLAPHERQPRMRNPIDWDLVNERRVNLLPDGFPIHLLAWPGQDAHPSALRAEAVYRYHQADRQSPDFPYQLKGAVETWQRQSVAPSQPEARLLLAEWAALNGKDSASSQAADLAENFPNEAKVLRAIYHARLGNFPDAARHLQAAFQSFQSYPWVRLAFMDSALTLASFIARQDPQAGILLYETLKRPFAGQALKSRRLTTLYDLAITLDFQGLCRETLAFFEPHVPWSESFLGARAACYEHHQDPAEGQARRDLELFRAGAAVTD